MGCNTTAQGQSAAIQSAADKATVIFGANMRLGAPSYISHQLHWTKFDIGEDKLESDTITFEMPSCSFRKTRRCEAGQTDYFIVRIPPGFYLYTGSTTHVSSEQVIEVGLRDTDLGRRLLNGTANVSETRYARFHVSAGETLYVGDFNFSGELWPKKFDGLSFDDIAAIRFLHANENFKGKMQRRAPISPHLPTKNN